MKLYTLSIRHKLGEIEECEVLKETEKTYTIKRQGWGKNLVRKSEMQVWGCLIFKTYDEAFFKLKELLKKRIEECQNTIKIANANIAEYTERLANLEKGGEAE